MSVESFNKFKYFKTNLLINYQDKQKIKLKSNKAKIYTIHLEKMGITILQMIY